MTMATKRTKLSDENGTKNTKEKTSRLGFVAFVPVSRGPFVFFVVLFLCVSS